MKVRTSILGVGHITFAVAIVGLGLLSLITGHFASVWQPVPAHIPGRELLAYVNGTIMLLLGMSLFLKRTAGHAAIFLTGYFLIWFFLLRGPIVASAPLVAGNWSGFGETGTLIVGGLILIAACSTHSVRSLPHILKEAAGIKIARIMFAFSAFLMSLDNLAYPKANADFPPFWLPHWYGWGYLVGGAYVATGLAILVRVCPKIATHAVAVMMTLLTLLCWVSFIVQAPVNRLKWTGFFISLALAGAGWLVAKSYRLNPWFELPLLKSSLLLTGRTADFEERQ